MNLTTSLIGDVCGLHTLVILMVFCHNIFNILLSIIIFTMAIIFFSNAIITVIFNIANFIFIAVVSIIIIHIIIVAVVIIILIITAVVFIIINITCNFPIVSLLLYLVILLL